MIVDDGSKDNTLNIPNDLSEKYSFITVRHNEFPQNIGSCYQQAAKDMDVDYITWFPTDGEINPNSLASLIEKMALDQIVIPYPNEGKKNRLSFRQLL
jgi:hypothetical protein